MAFDLAINLDLAGKKVLVVGGGTIASRKVASLLKVGALVKLVAPKLKAGLSARIKKAGGTLARRPYRASDLTGAWLVFAATDDSELNLKICQQATKKKIFASSASRATEGHFSLPAVAQAGPIRLTVSTGGASPAMAKALRKQLQSALRQSDLPALARQLGKRRRA